MKMHRFWKILVLAFVFAFIGCNDDDETTTSGPGTTPGQDELTCKLLNNQPVNRLGGTFSWAVEASEDWYLDLPTDYWVSIDPMQGKAGVTEVTVEIDALLGSEARVAVLPFILGEQEVDINVQQTLDGELPVNVECTFVDAKTLDGAGGESVNTLRASGDWTLTIDSDWLKVSPMSGTTGDTELTFTAEPSEGVARVACLSFTLQNTVIELSVVQIPNQTEGQ